MSSLSNRELFDPSVVAGIKRTLLIVLQDIDASGTDEWHLTEISRLDTEIDHGQETECKGREAEVLELQEIKPSADMTSKEVSQDVDPNEVESTIAKPIPVAISSTVATPLNQTPTGETISGKVQTTTEKKMSVTRSTQGGNLSVENPRVETEEGSTEEGNNPWVKFGMAALGVVAGGVLLSMQGGNNGNRSEDGEETDQRNESSTVKIEELKDDNEDEWVSIPKSN